MFLRKILVVLCLSFILLSHPMAVRAAEPKGSEQEGFIYQFYRDQAWEAVIMAPPEWVGIFNQSQPELEKYFDDKLVALILKDKAESQKEGDVGRLDFSPIWDSQDPTGVGDLEVLKTDKADVVTVTFRYPGAEQKNSLSYYLTKTARGLRIQNITSAGWSLLEILEAPWDSK